MQPALSQMLEENPESLIRKKDLFDKLRLIELEISNLDQASKSKALYNRKVDATINLQSVGSASSSGSTTSKTYNERNIVLPE